MACFYGILLSFLVLFAPSSSLASASVGSSEPAATAAKSSTPPNVKATGRFNHMNVASTTIQNTPPNIIVTRIKKGFFDFETLSLVGANLNGKDISNSDLKGRDLRHFHLAWANASGTNFDGADLSNAQLYHANLTGASLKGANLTDAQTWGTDFSDADLTGATVTAKHFAHAITNENTKREGLIILGDGAH